MRRRLNENLRVLIGDEQSVALSFSGGTDSTCLLLSMLELGYRPSLYTYCVEGMESEDLRRARWMSKEHGLPLMVCTIPSGVDAIIHDVHRMITDGVKGKVCIQCMHGHYYVAPAVKERIIVNGSGIDGLYGAYRTFAFNGSRKDKALFDQARQKHLDNPNDDAMAYQRGCYARHGTEVIFPYRQQNIIDLLMSLSWEEINRPRLKWVALQHYWGEIPKGHFRPRGSQQIVAGTRELHNKLLRSPMNQLGRKRVDEIYKDMASGRV